MANYTPDSQALSGNSVRGVADTIPESSADIAANADPGSLEAALRHAGDLVMQALDLTSQTVNHVMDTASDKAFESAANVGVNIATPPAQAAAQSGFSWGGYVQALGVLCFLLALLWFGVWLIRKYGKFNFLPRPGSLPKDALMMEAQMPLGPKKGLMVVRFMNRRLLLGVTEHKISLLAEDKGQNERQDSTFQGYLDNSANSGSNT